MSGDVGGVVFPATHRIADIYFNGTFSGTTLSLNVVVTVGGAQSYIFVANSPNLVSASVEYGGSTVLNKFFLSDAPSLASFRAINAIMLLDKGKSKKAYTNDFGIIVENADLNAVALDQLYTDLATVTGIGMLRVSGNPGTGSDNTSIATNKGWVVFGS
jgi:hypothetical protein